ncbi:MAG: acylphosphatase [Candidatus Cloacimonadales bacterium]|nr:acylphosphatase [Candidatus Cloacimonadales bacterium]
MRKLEIVISGRVQGVGFRYFTVRLAQEYNILGNVQNSYDGKVRVVAVGSEKNLELFLQELRHGPRLALVEDMKITELSAVHDFNNFRIEY